MKKALVFLLLCCLSVSVYSPALSAENYINGWTYRDNGDGTIILLGYSAGEETKLVIPDTIDGKPVTAISEQLIHAKPPLISVSYPGATQQQELYLSDITEITIPDSVVTVLGNPFFNCIKLEKIIISPEHPALEIIDGALYSKADRRLVCAPGGAVQGTLKIADGTSCIGKYAFYRCTGLTKIIIPDSVSEIQEGAFYRCDHLADIRIPEGVKVISDQAFYNCSKLSEISLPYSLNHIGDEAFSLCYMSEICIPRSVKSIGSKAFYDCFNLSRVTIEGNSIISMGDNPFARCFKLSGIFLAEDHPYLEVKNGALCSKPDQRLIYGPYLQDGSLYAVPEGTREIGNMAFFDNSHLTQIQLPDSITSIEDYAFYECARLNKINVPKSLVSVGEKAFYNCYYLKGKLNFPSSVNVGFGALTFDPSPKPIPERKASLETYQIVLLITFAVIMLHLISSSFTILIAKKKSIKNGYAYGLLLGLVGIIIMLLKRKQKAG